MSSERKPVGPESYASDVYEARLQVGRVLSGPMLTLAVVVRVLVTSVLTAGWTGEWLAPAWVVVTRRDNGCEVGRVPAGREQGVGEALLRRVRDSMCQQTPTAFLRHHHLSEPSSWDR